MEENFKSKMEQLTIQAKTVFKALAINGLADFCFVVVYIFIHIISCTRTFLNDAASKCRPLHKKKKRKEESKKSAERQMMSN